MGSGVRPLAESRSARDESGGQGDREADCNHRQDMWFELKQGIHDRQMVCR